MFFRSIASLYDLRLARSLITRLHSFAYSPLKLLAWFWHTKSFASVTAPTEAEQSLVVLLGLAMLAQVGIGIGFLVQWTRLGTAGTWEFGLALLLSYPLVWAHVVVLLAAIGRGLYWLAHPKKLGRAIVCTKLEWQVRKLRTRHDFSVVAVAGSVGKTSTKLAIANLLGQSLRVRHQSGNYNDRVTVPLIFFGHKEPNILNIFAWFKIFRANTEAIKAEYPYDVVVVELGTDAPGLMKEFAYLKPDIAVLTAISPEHMEFFKTLDAVAAEELTVFDYSETVLVNADDIAGTYLVSRTFKEYSLKSKQADYYATSTARGLQGLSLQLRLAGKNCSATVQYVGAQGAKFALAAAAVADLLKVASTGISKGLPQLQHFAGRMQVLPGVKGTVLIDDTYNASPIAVCAALDVLYAAKTPQRIAILGSMNELGNYSEAAHREVGVYCDASKLDMLVTIGADANEWLLPEAKANGCTVHPFTDPYEAGAFVKSQLKKDTVVLAKGSQNGVFAEEALKQLLAHKSDTTKLVRQSPYWLKKKQQQFNSPK